MVNKCNRHQKFLGKHQKNACIKRISLKRFFTMIWLTTLVYKMSNIVLGDFNAVNPRIILFFTTWFLMKKRNFRKYWKLSKLMMNYTCNCSIVKVWSHCLLGLLAVIMLSWIELLFTFNLENASPLNSPLCCPKMKYFRKRNLRTIPKI